MIKKLLRAGAIVAIIIVVFSGASWWSGMRIESRAYAAVDAINLHLARTWSDQVRVSLREHQRGVFSSQSSYVLTFPKKTETAHNREVLFLNHIIHGPFPIKNILAGDFKPVSALIETSIAPTPWTQGLFLATQGQSFITGRTRLDMTGVATLNWTALPFDLRHDMLRTQFGGAQLSAEIGPRLQTRKGELTLESLNVADSQTTFDLKAVKIETDSRPGPAGFALGKSKREIGTLNWSSLNAPTIALQKLVIRSTLTSLDSDIAGETIIDLAALSVAKNKFGAFKLNVLFDQMDDRAFGPLLELSNRFLTHTAANILAPEGLSQNEIKKLWLHIHGLLKNHPNLRFQPLTWETEKGSSQLSLNMMLKPAELTNSGIGLRESPIDTLDATLTISQPMVENLVLQQLQNAGTPQNRIKILSDREIKRLTDMSVQLKFGRPQNGKIVAHLNVQDGEFRINGQRSPSEPISKLLATLVPVSWLSQPSAPGQTEPDEAIALQHLDPDVLSGILSHSDFTYEESRDEDGDLVLKVEPGDSGAETIEIVFLGCRDDPTCEDVLLRATYSPDQQAALKFVNDWNLRNRWGRAFVSESRGLVLEMDISAYGGIGQDAIESMVSTFFKQVRDFAKELAAADSSPPSPKPTQ
jgi:uncharacterized protein YdgA (DUF945 family)